MPDIFNFYSKDEADGRILAVCAGRKIGEPKKSVGQAQLVRNFGLSGDCEAEPGGQLYLLSQKDFLALKRINPALIYGISGENLAVTMDLTPLPPGTRLRSGDALLELTTVKSPLYRARVILAGIVTEGDQILVE
jgi:MOSC domain-containing protein YiiM